MRKLPLVLSAALLCGTAADALASKPASDRGDEVILHAWSWSLDTIANNMKTKP